MAGTDAVLGQRNGDLQARLMFVAEAPGRLGAARSGIPLCGDQSGRNFERLLASAGIRREDVFITNSVLCNPLDDLGRNSAPLRTEIRNCRSYLERTIDLVDPPFIATLGTVALQALQAVHPHQLTLRDGVASPAHWNGRVLVPLYHPSPRAQLHRSFEQQLADFEILARLLSRGTLH